METEQPLVTLVNSYTYSPRLKHGAENYLLDAFEAGVKTTKPSSLNGGEDSFAHTGLLMNIAMHILCDASWVQPQGDFNVSIGQDSLDEGSYEEPIDPSDADDSDDEN